MVEPAELFEKLECNDTQVIESARSEIYSLFQNVKDSWVANGLYDYYLNSNSLRSMEILANVNEPHHKYLFDRLTESIKRQETELKVKALTLLGHIVRKQPTWIYKICDHPLMREILSVLKNEEDILALISALLLVIVLIPMIPSLIAHHLQEIFDIFSRLAAWNLGSGALLDKQMMIHMQISLYALFLRLYGMYPCNFIAYLRTFYRDKNNPVFIHTIQPMLETVRMHPQLVTASKDNETSAERWKTLGAQQVIAECEQFYVDVIDKCPHDCCYVTTGFRSRSGTTNSTIAEDPKYLLGQLNDLCLLLPPEDKRFFSPSFAFPERTLPSSSIPANFMQHHFISTCSQEGTSPPEAAIEATPETTPVRDARTSANPRTPQIASSVVRGLSSFSKIRSLNTTPTHSQPSSPMCKDNISPFHFPSSNVGLPERDSLVNQKLQKILYDRSQSADNHCESYFGLTPLNVPSSPVKIIGPSDPSRRNESPLSIEDEEVKAIVAQRKDTPSLSRVCDSVLHEDVNVENGNENNTLEQGSPCSKGGLHMPNSKSMNDFAKRVQRLRCHSQNYDREPIDMSTESSPGKGDHLETGFVKRTNSCPDMKKKSPIVTKTNRALKKTDEEICEEETSETRNSSKYFQESVSHRETQTEDGYMTYEHLFLNIFPCLGNTDIKASPSPSPMPIKPFGNKENHHTAHLVLDKYIETSKGDVHNNAIQIQLLQQQLLFERYRRETFSARNRKLLADAKNIKALEEYNSALKDTIQLQQKDVESMKEKLCALNAENFEKIKKLLHYQKFLEERITVLQDQVLKCEYEKKEEKHNRDQLKDKYNSVDNERQQACGSLLAAYAEMNMAKEQAAMGERARSEVERLNRELILMGELQLKYQEKISEEEMIKQVSAESDALELHYKEDVQGLKVRLDTNKAITEACRQKIIDLENVISEKDGGIAQLKRSLLEVNTENFEKMKAVECKYKAQLSINRALEQKILQLFTKIELPGLRNLHSPETSSCHEAIATASASGLSPHSSPLSVSLASSESSTAFMSSDIKDMKNLQVLVDKKTGKLDGSVECAGDTMELFPPLSNHSGTPQQND